MVAMVGDLPRRLLNLAYARPSNEEAARLYWSQSLIQHCTTLQLRREMKNLLKEPPFGEFDPMEHTAEGEGKKTVAEVCNTGWVKDVLTSAWPTMKDKAPRSVALLSQLMQNQYIYDAEIKATTADGDNSGPLFMMLSTLMNGLALQKSSFLPRVLGVYMLANGTPRRVIDTLNGMGLISSYSTLNRLLNTMEVAAQKNIKLAAHDPNAVIVYDNFNFMNRIRELAGGKKDRMVNLTTACLIACPELDGPLKQSSFNLTKKFTKQMELQYLVPHEDKALDSVSRYLVNFAIGKVMKAEKDDLAKYPGKKCLTFKESPILQLGAIFEDEGTLDGVYNLHEELFKRRLEFKEYDERMTLVHGDQKTVSYIRRIQQDQVEASDKWEQKRWMLPVPAFFHVELNFIEMMFRVFWDTSFAIDRKKGTKQPARSSATISADVQFFQRGKNITKKDIKYHQVMPLLMHGFTARILAFLVEHLIDSGALGEHLTVDDVHTALKAMDTDNRKAVLKKV